MKQEEKENAEYWEHMYFQCKKAQQIGINDQHFYMVALNLSGKREELEQKAEELISKEGYIEALTKTRKTKSEVAKAEEKIIKNFLKWTIDNDYVGFNNLLYNADNVNVKTDVAENLIKEYIENNKK